MHAPSLPSGNKDEPRSLERDIPPLTPMSDQVPEESSGLQFPSRTPASRLLSDFARQWPGDRVRLRDIAEVLDDRAYGILLLVLAIPNIIPNPIPGLSGMLGVPLILVAGQLMIGRPLPWLPSVLADRSMSTDSFRATVAKIMPWLEKLERLLHPRFRFLCKPPSEQLLAAFCVVLGIVLALPIPLGNTPSALAISLIALGLIEHDGLAIGAGVLAGTATLAIASAVVIGLVKAALFFLQAA